ncbi:MAG: FecR domain-containing protein [Proteobacteria bacterium]|nr:FecR domain-containing protein [Pseudomonadota bacterium]
MAPTRGQERESLIAEAADWLARLDVGRASREELDAWRAADPRRAAAFAEVAATWNRLGELPAPEALLRVKSSITRRVFLGSALAASAAGVGVLGWMERDYFLRSRIVTAIGERRTLSLPDGSSMDLNTDTEVYWKFDDQVRKLWLRRGEAALSIAADLVRPFVLVTAQGLTTLAAGQFNARLRSGELELFVLSGQALLKTVSGQNKEVTVASASDPRRKLITDGQQFEVAPAREEAVQSVQAWRRGEIIFNGQPLSDAVEEYNRYLSRKFVIGDRKVANLRLGGRFLTDDPQRFLAALRSAFGLRVTDDGTSAIVLNSP